MMACVIKNYLPVLSLTVSTVQCPMSWAILTPCDYTTKLWMESAAESAVKSAFYILPQSPKKCLVSFGAYNFDFW